MLPSHVHAIVCISKVHKPTMRALAYARASRPRTSRRSPSTSTPTTPRRCSPSGTRRDIPVPLKVLASPYRQITKPVLDYVRSIRSGNPRDLVTVYLPEYVLGRWWEQVLHNHSALRLKARLLFTPGVMVVSVPWQLQSSEGAERDWIDEPPIPAPCAAERRGSVDRELPSRSSATEWTVDVGPVAHGGHCVARHEGQVVFVRHTLPGERVVAGSPRAGRRPLRPRRRRRGARASPAPGRAALPVCRPGPLRRLRLPARRPRHQRAAQGRRGPRAVLAPRRSRRRRRGGASPATRIGLRWRSRVEFAVDDAGARGCDSTGPTPIVPVDDCLIATSGSSNRACSTPTGPTTGVDVIDAAHPDEPVLVAPSPDGRPGRPRPSSSRRLTGGRVRRRGAGLLAGAPRRRPDLPRPRPRAARAAQPGDHVARPLRGSGLFTMRPRRARRPGRFGAGSRG